MRAFIACIHIHAVRVWRARGYRYMIWIDTFDATATQAHVGNCMQAHQIAAARHVAQSAQHTTNTNNSSAHLSHTCCPARSSYATQAIQLSTQHKQLSSIYHTATHAHTCCPARSSYATQASAKMSAAGVTAPEACDVPPQPPTSSGAVYGSPGCECVTPITHERARKGLQARVLK